MEFNLFPFAVEALGTNKKIYKDIDQIYQTRKYEFYRAAKAHDLYTHQIVTEGNLMQEEYCKKALGILLVATGEELDSDLNQSLSDIFRKGWTYAYLFVVNNTKIDLEKFLRNIVKKSGGIDNLTDDEINSSLFVAYFLALNSGKPIIDNKWREKFEDMMIQRWNHYREDDPTRISLKKLSPEHLAKIREMKRQIFAQYGRFTDYNSMYGRLRERAETLALLYDYEGLSCQSVFDSVKFKEKDIDEILLAYLPPKRVIACSKRSGQFSMWRHICQVYD